MNQERFNHLKSLSPLEAVEAWLSFSFGIDDEPAMIEAIRKDPRVTITDEQIGDIVMDAIDQGWDAAACLERLAAGPHRD